ncbi:MAG: TolB family protein [Planctomycetota bacterium]
MPTVNRFVHLALVTAVAALSAAGCSSVRRLSDATFGPSDTQSVPRRTTVGAASTTVATAGAAGTSQSTANSSMSLDEVGGAPAQGAESAPRRGSLLGGVYGDVRKASDNGLTEGGGNLAQVSFATDGGDYAPDVDRTGTFMVFASTQHRPTFDVYRKSVDGRTVTQLTTDPSDDLMPAISPDGASVAFSSNRNGNWDIFIMPVSGGAPTQVTSDADDEVQPTWAPDGKRLAFSRKNARTGTWEIWIVDSTAPGVRTFVCEGFLPRWSPVAEKDSILFQRARQRGTRLYGVWTIDIVRGEGMNPTEIVSSKNAAVLQPNWSPDGARIVFTTVVNPAGDSDWPEQSDIWVVNVDGTGRVGLTNSRFRNMQPVWGGDGRIYFVSNRNGVENIWAIAADGVKNGAEGGAIAANTPKKRGTSAAGAQAATPAATAPNTPAPEFLRPTSVAGAGTDGGSTDQN